MKQSPSQYGGFAAVLVLGIGLLAIGRTWTGIGTLVFGVLAMAIALSSSASTKALFVSVGAIILGGVLAHHALSNELTGTATYHESKPFQRGWTSEPVTRKDSPGKFRAATNYLWTGTSICLTAGVVAFKFARKLDYTDEF